MASDTSEASDKAKSLPSLAGLGPGPCMPCWGVVESGELEIETMFHHDLKRNLLEATTTLGLPTERLLRSGTRWITQIRFKEPYDTFVHLFL